jgi:hypothetical protein
MQLIDQRVNQNPRRPTVSTVNGDKVDLQKQFPKTPATKSETVPLKR